jgi:lipoprotein-anchoring transpeptidase ErfK/SrfK
MDWTNGCIALTNAEVSELRRYVSRGTEVVIVE